MTKFIWKLLNGILVTLIVGLVFGPSGMSPSTTQVSSRAPGAPARIQEQISPPPPTFSVGEIVTPDISPAARDLPTDIEYILNREINPRHLPVFMDLAAAQAITKKTMQVDPLIEGNRLNTGQTPALLLDFEGVGNLAYNVPPDTNGDVGPHHYVQMVNVQFAVFDKSGTLLSGPTSFNQLFSGTGGNCQTRNDGDPIVVYDALADRWLLSQFAEPSHLCVAISQTPDPTGTFYLYEFDMVYFPDYFKLGLWPDGYYMSANDYELPSYSAYVFDRTKMLAGEPATYQKFTGETNFLLPSDLDGNTPSPTYSPNYFYTFKDDSFHDGTDRLEVFAFSVDWTTPANSSFSRIATIPITAFAYTPCGYFEFECIRQPDTTQRVDALGEWPMHRFPYRNFGTHESLVGTFGVGGGLGEVGAAIRWFELRKTSGGQWTLYQEGTLDPGDGHDRFVGSIAQDQQGNIALGYSVSSSTRYPSIHYATRLADDPLGTLQTEAILITGSGSQLASNISNRWGDYSAMSIDPADDCTFWYTNQYYETSSTIGWQTRVGTFKLPACGEKDFTLAVTPATQVICTPDQATYTVNVGQSLTAMFDVTLTVHGEPTGTLAIFAAGSVQTPATTTLTISNTGIAIFGNYALDIVGSSLTRTHTSTVQLDIFDTTPAQVTLLTPGDGLTDTTTSPILSWTAAMQVQTYTLEIATDAMFSNVVYTATLPQTQHRVSKALSHTTIYYWHVTPQNICGNGAASNVFSFTTHATSPILLVDDDDNTPDVRAYYTTTLDTLGVSYEVWDTVNSDSNEPAAIDLTPYETVIWFTGNEFGDPTGPGTAGETALGTFLDGGGCFLISSQDYLWAKGEETDTPTPFMQTYLGLASGESDVRQTIVTGTGVIFDDLGPYPLAYPFNNYSDAFIPTTTARLAFAGDKEGASLSKNNGIYKTTWLGFPFEALPTTAAREETLSAFLIWCASTGYTLDVTTLGAGQVMLDPPGGTYSEGTVVTLTAEANVGSTFAGWGGELSGMANPITLTIDSNKAITATFDLLTYTLDIAITGDGTGIVTPTIGNHTYTYGSVVWLTATAGISSTFEGWNGALSGFTNPISLTLDGNKAVTATFNLWQPHYTLRVDIEGKGRVTVIPSQTTYLPGSMVTLTAVPASGWRFVQWGGDLESTNTLYIAALVMNKDRHVTALFIPGYQIFLPLVIR
ncbi:MAG: hypothetical protein JXA33_20085 [Anaerolineae bacterium]|nr:hypothetical protein [Anaerolineae bacterium]